MDSKKTFDTKEDSSHIWTEKKSYISASSKRIALTRGSYKFGLFCNIIEPLYHVSSFKNFKINELFIAKHRNFINRSEPIIDNMTNSISVILLTTNSDRKRVNEKQKIIRNSNPIKSKGLLLNQIGIKQYSPHQKLVLYSSSACYICEMANTLGKFISHKANLAGIRTGPLYAELQRGSPVSAYNGKTIYPSETLSLNSPGPLALIVNSPTNDLAKTLVYNPFFRKYQKGNKRAKRIFVVIHLSPIYIVKKREYRLWMSRFRKNTNHLLLNPLKIRALNEINYFGKKDFKNTGTYETQFSIQNQIRSDTTEKIRTFLPLSKVDGFVNLTPRSLIKRNLNSSKFLPNLVSKKNEDKIKTFYLPPTYYSFNSIRLQNKDLSEEDGFEVSLIGINKPTSSKFSTLCCVFMDLPSTGCILLDSGDGSLSVMIRRFGLEGTFERLRRLKLVWISNTDVDYHAGLIEILKLHGNLVDIFNFKRFTHPLVLLAPMPLLRVLLRLPHFQFRKFKYADCFQTEKLELSLLGVTYMNACKKKWKKYAMLNSQSCFDWRAFYHETQNSSFGIRNQYEKHIIKKIPLKTKVSLLNNLLPTQDFSKQQMVLEIENLLGSICITSVRTVPDPHSFGCILESKKGWKLVYSGASWPCPQLMKSVKGATLFINKVEFKEKKVFEKLIPLSNQLEVFCTLVLKFFQRFDKLNEFIKKIQTWCCIASDMITIRIQDLPTFLFILPFVRSCLGF